MAPGEGRTLTAARVLDGSVFQTAHAVTATPTNKTAQAAIRLITIAPPVGGYTTAVAAGEKEEGKWRVRDLHTISSLHAWPR